MVLFLGGCANTVKLEGETLYPIYGVSITVDTFGWSGGDGDEVFEFDWNDAEILSAQEKGAEFADATFLRLFWLTPDGLAAYEATSGFPNDSEILCEMFLARDDGATWAFETDPSACVAAGFALPEESGAIAADAYLWGADGEVADRADFTGVWGGWGPSSTP
jgi:hypothetical protein